LTDVYLLALAVSRGGALVTFDRSIAIDAVRGATAASLIVL
jgi:predicted nucleic acid-binding protein